ncbi:CopG family transcriptional regulator [Sedimenticola sp.]|uniref:ribbon-helix-helix domain-containing protein n=1 Tax=Sedimenticola sp. TaxID=1940285 RepID=UPI003D116864
MRKKVTVSLQPWELDLLDELAEKRDLSRSAYLRFLLFADCDRCGIKPRDHATTRPAAKRSSGK